MEDYKYLMDIGYQFMLGNQWGEAIKQFKIFDLTFLVLQFALLLKQTVEKHEIKKLCANINQENMKIVLKGI